MLQLARRNFVPSPPNAARPLPTWNPTREGPQAVPITTIRYRTLTDAASAGPGDLGTVWVNLGLQNATTVHRVRKADAALFSTALCTSYLPDSHPLLLAAPDVIPPVRLVPRGHGHALLPADHPLIARGKLEHERRARAPLVWVAKPLLENPWWRIETDEEREMRVEVAKKLWGEGRGRIRGGRDVPGNDDVDGDDHEAGDV
jgi:hypothetical protein